MAHLAANWSPQPDIQRSRNSRPSIRSRNGSHKSMRDSSSSKSRSTQPYLATAQPDFSYTGPEMGSQFGSELEDPSGTDVHHFRKAKRYFCDALGCRHRKSFSSHSDLIRHRKTTHRELNDGDELWQCPVVDCKTPDKLYPRLDNFKQHVVRVHGKQYLDKAIESIVICRLGNLGSRCSDASVPAASSLSQASRQPLSLSSGKDTYDVRHHTDSAYTSVLAASATPRDTDSMHDMHQLFPPMSHVGESSGFPPVSTTQQNQAYSYEELLPINGDDSSAQPSHSIFPNGVLTLAGSEGTLASSFGTSLISGPHERSSQVMGGDSEVAPSAQHWPSTPKLQVDTSTPLRSRRRSQGSSISQGNELLSPYYRPRAYRLLSGSSPIQPPCDNLQSGQCNLETSSVVAETQLTLHEEDAAARLAWQILLICAGYAKECGQPAQGQASGLSSGRASIPNQAASGSGNRSNQSRSHEGGNCGEGGNQGHESRLPEEPHGDTDGPTRRKWFACPYYKHDYRRYSQENENDGEILYRYCAIVSNRNVAQLKTHLDKRHTRPRIYCNHCFQPFEKLPQLERHYLERLCVSPGTPDRYDTEGKMTHMTQYLVEQRKPMLDATEEDYWYGIHRILFPRDGEPDSPYIDVEYCRTVQTHFEAFLRVGPIAQSIVDLYRQAQHEDAATTILNVGIIDRAWALVQQLISQREPDPAAFAQFIGKRDSEWVRQQQQWWTFNNQFLIPSNNSQVPMSSNAGSVPAYTTHGTHPSTSSLFETGPVNWIQPDPNAAYFSSSQESGHAGPSTQIYPIDQDSALAQFGVGQHDDRLLEYTRRFQAYDNLGNADAQMTAPSLPANFDMRSTLGSQTADGADTNMSTNDHFSGSTYS